MGLDWRPFGKPKPGFEERFNEIFRIIQGKDKIQLSFLDKLKGKKRPTHDELLDEWFSIQIKSYETIKAPLVGRDAPADKWLKDQYESSDKSVPYDEFAREFNGYYVIELAEETDGVPVYIAMGQDRNVFRGQFLADCKDLIGEDLLNEAWETKLADDTLKYGIQLLAIADEIASANNLQHIKDQRIPPDTDENSLESKLHILYSAGKWLTFYGKNGHGFEADF
ncbi:hypothetical protein [Chitinophaga niabensis]|uniref:Uncharacterized protein n=1 Tax=Chitinophaga niabensis TaxID=536979 RepID=A0A1N6KGR6_9BACT|nr:hypothetical protein [Chitinophaga niabensis]SIO55761.1 hypothetical protein SAMN04488055_5813 [Chitinophaga niabensis]